MWVFLVLGCHRAPELSDVSVDAPVPGIARVSFTSSVAGQGGVSAACAGGEPQEVVGGEGTDHAVEVRGLRHGETCALTPWVEVDGERFEGDPRSLDVGIVRADLPALTRTTWAPDAACGEGGYLLTSLLTLQGASWVVIVDREGAPVWAFPGETGEWLARARPGRDGESLLWLHNDPRRVDDLGRITRMGLDGTVRSETRAFYAHHDFVERADGRFAWLSYVFADGLDVDGTVRDVVTDTILEADEGAEEGDETVVFSMLEDYPGGIFDPGQTVAESSFIPGRWEFSHGNSLMLDADGEHYYALFRWLDALIKVDRQGALQWQLGGAASDFTGPDGEAFDRPHMSSLWDGGFAVFDNADHTVGISGPAEYTFDEQAKTWDRTFEYRDPAGKLELLLGDTVPMPGCDHLLVAWSTSGRIDELTRDHEVVWSLQAPTGWIVSRVTWLPDLYTLGE